MTSQIVNLQVAPAYRLTAILAEDDGWKGLCKSCRSQLVAAVSKDAKKNMATELQAQIEEICGAS